MVTVTFIDETTSATIATVELAVDSLPDSFELQTTLNLGDDQWSVMQAEPSSKVEFAKTGKLTLRLHKIEMMKPADLLYSLPSICDRLPDVLNATPGPDDLVLSEDDWRQFELVSRAFTDQTSVEIAAIRAIHEQQRAGIGWKKIHVRKHPDPPIASALSRQDIAKAFGDVIFARVCFGRSSIADGFSFGVDEMKCYGIEENSVITVLGVARESEEGETAEALARLAHEFDLELVKWCRCARAEWDDPLFAQLLMGSEAKGSP